MNVASCTCCSLYTHTHTHASTQTGTCVMCMYVCVCVCVSAGAYPYQCLLIHWQAGACVYVYVCVCVRARASVFLFSAHFCPGRLSIRVLWSFSCVPEPWPLSLHKSAESAYSNALRIIRISRSFMRSRELSHIKTAVRNTLFTYG